MRSPFSDLCFIGPVDADEHSIAETHGLLDQDALAPLVEQAFSGAELIGFDVLTGGVSAQVYRLDLRLADGGIRRVVLRIAGGTHPRNTVEREFALQRDLFHAGLPVPKPLFVDATCAYLDSPSLIMTFVEGSTLPPDDGMESYIDQMGQMLAMIHRTEVGVFAQLPKRLDPMEDVFEFLPQGAEWDALRQLLSDQKDTAFAGRPMLLHGDFWPGNLIVADNRIEAVLDWEDAAIGDPLSDVACTCLELRYICGKAGMDRFRKAYSRHESIEAGRLSLWLIYVAAAAQKYMGDWGLDPSREAHMRQTALRTLKEAAADLAHSASQKSSRSSV